MRPSWLTATTIARLKAAYRCAITTFPGHGVSIWGLISEKQTAIHAALMSDSDSDFGSLLELATFFSDPGRTYLYYGVDNIYPDFRDVEMESPLQKGLQKQAMDALIILADSLGATRCWNPEGGALFPHKEPKSIRGADDLLTDIENVLGITLQFPSPFPGENGLSSARGLVTYRAINAIYQAHRVNQITNSGRCIEIGGGVGRTAYFANKLGVDDYTLVDLPMTLAGQALFLMATLGPESVWLYGEPVAKQKGCIRLVPPVFISETSERFGVVFNADSFTEMDRSHAKEYVDFALSNSDALLSINHEANQFTVRELMPNLSCIRSPYWLRSGYVEEFLLL